MQAAPADAVDDFAKMETVNGKGDGEGKEAWLSQQRPAEQFPVLEPLLADDPQEEERFEEGDAVARFQAEAARCGGVVFPEKADYPRVVVAGRVNGGEDIPVPTDQCVEAHVGHEIEGNGRIVARGVVQQPSLPEEALMEPGAAQGGKHPHHGGDYAALLDEADLPFEDGRGVTVEADDEPRLHLQAGLLDPPDGGEEI